MMASFLIRPPGQSRCHSVDLTRDDVRSMTIEEMQWHADFIDELRRMEKGQAGR